MIGYGEFSGIRNSIVAALRSAGCRVIEEKHTLRQLPLCPLYVSLTAVSALLVYRSEFRRYMSHTAVASWVRSKANQAIVDRHGDVDAVLSLQKIAPNFIGASGNTCATASSPIT